MQTPDTIAAIATPPGIGGVGIVRVAGPAVRRIAAAVLGRLPEPRRATTAAFRDAAGDALDVGIALFFEAPHSFTGDDVLELQGHGGPVVLDALLRRVIDLGARIARPGEFSQRAFLNGKIDLVQAEAIADLIEARTAQAAGLALRMLRGDFSRRISALAEDLVQLRTLVEANLDFPDDSTDLSDPVAIGEALGRLIEPTEAILAGANHGRVYREGLTVVVAGLPNAGKSSLMNALAGDEVAIVTQVPGTTRDLLRQEIAIDGIPMQLIDTAGLRESEDPVEREGVRRARQALERSDHVLWVVDATAHEVAIDAHLAGLAGVARTIVRNKLDLLGEGGYTRATEGGTEIGISAVTGDGLAQLRAHLRLIATTGTGGEGCFLTRRRHIDALERTLAALRHAGAMADAGGLELVAEDLRDAHGALGEITGAFSSEDLLDRIFSSFCIGK
jgi:tRNA modification GTPase